MRPDEVRLERREVDLDHAVEEALGVGVDLGVVAQVLGVRGRRGRRALRARSPSGTSPCCASYGNSEHVAPISAPMLQIVALPVAEIDSRAGPEVLDDRAGAALHVRMPATLRMTSFGAAQPDSSPVRRTPISFGTRVLNGQPAITSTASRAADADRDHAEPAGVRRVRVGADHHPAGERVVLEHDLVDDPAARLPEADAVLRATRCAGTRRPREFASSAAARSASAPTRAWIRWSQCTVVGTATVGSPASMNCSSAICAVASCIATRSGR